MTSVDEVDQPGMRIASTARSAYGLWLERNIRHAELVEATSLDGAMEAFVDQGLDALAGLRPRLLTDVEQLPGARLLEGRFTAVQQAMGTPRGRDEAGIAYLRAFVEAAKASGLVAELHRAPRRRRAERGRPGVVGEVSEPDRPGADLAPGSRVRGQVSVRKPARMRPWPSSRWSGSGTSP